MARMIITEREREREGGRVWRRERERERDWRFYNENEFDENYVYGGFDGKYVCMFCTAKTKI